MRNIVVLSSWHLNDTDDRILPWTFESITISYTKGPEFRHIFLVNPPSHRGPNAGQTSAEYPEAVQTQSTLRVFAGSEGCTAKRHV